MRHWVHERRVSEHVRELVEAEGLVLISVTPTDDGVEAVLSDCLTVGSHEVSDFDPVQTATRSSHIESVEASGESPVSS